jgi:RimJ/RimL family protein N-acetyltransferase
MPPTPIAELATPLTDGIVTVRMRRDGDLPYIAAAADDPESAAWLDEFPNAAPSTPQQIADIWATGRAAPLMIAHADSGEPTGLISLQFRADGDTTVAYRVFPAWRGRGIAARALELVSDWAFDELHLSVLLLEIDERNTASLRVAARCAFTRCGTTNGGESAKAVFRRDRRHRRMPVCPSE